MISAFMYLFLFYPQMGADKVHCRDAVWFSSGKRFERESLEMKGKDFVS